ncbi:hypothetical protein NEF87_003665 [Candidatus Lokiarchaeum ossiferum]|uniref:Uncharacterized protein n=1 Tax=Candidatus Lokiarchaeum ossiferum TaxID=2951803 RepID=A0ABY6HV26_9ARCH|nr:hypothetical protein NEF87_003665 [Candidatus Lokiarchaeum sp. B-35]
MADKTNKFKGDGTDELRRLIVNYYRNHVYGAFADNFLEWNPKNKLVIIDLIKQEFQECDLQTIESIMDEYYKEF